MKQGDLVDTPHGQGKFFEVKKEDDTMGLVRLKDPIDGAVWHPLITPEPMWDCYPLNEILMDSMTVLKTAEDMYKEHMAAQEAQKAAAFAHAKAQHEEMERRMNDAQQTQTQQA